MKNFTCKLKAFLFSSLVFSMSTFAAVTNPDSFIITVKTNNPGTSATNAFTIPTFGTGYDYSVDCYSDGTPDAINQTGDYTCDYGLQPGDSTWEFQITIDGDFPRIYFNNEGDVKKLLAVNQWGTQQWDSIYNGFYGATNLHILASDKPDLTNITTLQWLFRDA